MEGFQEGYDFFIKSAGSIKAASAGQAYVGRVSKAIDVLTKKLNSMKGYKTDIGQLKGDAAEFWHGGTFNIDAAVRGSKNEAIVGRSHGFASPDITLLSDEQFGSKYDATEAKTAADQAKTYWERYKKYINDHKGKDNLPSYEEYLRKNGIDPDSVLPNDPIYGGQYRLVSSDQYNKIIKYLKRKIAEEKNKRPDQVKRYQETLDMLTDRVRDAEGNESIPLSKEKAEVLAQLAKEGGFDPADWGLTTEELIKYKYVLQQSFRAGLSAATISMVLKIAPEIIKAFQYLIENGELDKEQFQKIGFAALSGGAEGFVRGSVSAAITTACKAGLWGETFKSVDPTIIGTITVVAMDTMKNAYAVSIGKTTSREMVDEFVKELYVSTCSLLVGSMMAAELPIIGFMLGSFVGSVVGSITYSVGYNAVLSFCVDTGFTMFGLVDQDYTLPENIMEQIGLDVFEYEHFEAPKFQQPKFEIPKFQQEKFMADSVEIIFLRRGVIGVRQIAYV